MALKVQQQPSPTDVSLHVTSLIVHIESGKAIRIASFSLITTGSARTHTCVRENSGYTLMFPQMQATADAGLAQGDSMPVKAIITVFHYGSLDRKVRAELESIEPGLANKFLAQ